ncbi:sigma-70 family RNA polymerase sigma factor [Spirosoma sp.]|uniref:RNA polymerase sigma factor n=1 Tax=Spirosoma sp. TaxID=1899569 RepID=UPI00260FBC2D|nr:sigma-70 family RNA polymerase sigma factor [Spirosoma sp.]MCX6215791.1 sigma-70 family RNA polymerase sigma factor [Spirosoma sp.]
MTEQDTTLWQLFREGDRQAFEALLRAYYRPLFDYGSKFLNDRELLKDCVHDLFVSLWERRAFLGPVVNLRVYLFTALRNRIFQQYQKNTIFVNLPDEWEDNQSASGNYIENRIIEDETDAATRAHLHKTISRLSQRQQEVIHLKFFENLTNEQIALVLNISRPAATNLLSLALKSVREQWGPLFLFLYFFTHL